MQVCPIISEWLLETRVGQKWDRGQTEVREKLEISPETELVRVKRYVSSERK